MTIQEALQSGKPFKRPNWECYYTQLEHFSKEDVLATDYELQPDRSIELTETALKQAWNEVRTSFTSVKAAEDSPLFRALVHRLFG
jgi:hypothetical protein